jgi:N-methylhydantoinase A
VLTWRLEVVAPRPEIRLEGEEGDPRAPDQAQKGAREIYLPEDGDFREVSVYDRYRLDPGVIFEGPAVVEERESTVVLGSEGRAEIDAARNLIVRWS